MWRIYSGVNALKEKTDELYIYGAGMRGRELCLILKRNGISVDGFVATKVGNKSEFMGFPVFAVSTVKNSNVGIILGLNDDYTKEVVDYLKREKMDFTKGFIKPIF